jgi:transposase
MPNFTGSLRVFWGIVPVDLRKSLSGLLALVMNRLKEDPLQGALFVFSNCSRFRLKMLYWDGTGLWVLVKRLEKGTFAWPAPAETAAVKLQLAPEALSLLTTGVDMRGGAFSGLVRGVKIFDQTTKREAFGEWHYAECPRNHPPRKNSKRGLAPRLRRWTDYASH